MNKPQPRQPAGTPKGGQWAPSPLAMNVDTKDMRLDFWQEVRDNWDGIYDVDDWGTGQVGLATNLPKSMTTEEHHHIAHSQTPICDTAAEMWLSHSRHHEHVLSYLRGDEGKENITPFEIEMAKKLQDSILEAELDTKCVVYRGMCSNLQSSDDAPSGRGMHHVVELVKTVDPGDMIMSEGFWSTSTDPTTAATFANPIVRDNPTTSVVFRIETPIGKFLPSSSAEDCYHFHPEREVVLPHGALFEVINKETIVNDLSRDRNKVILFSLRYIGIEDEAASLAYLTPSEFSDEDDKLVRNDVRFWLKQYERSGLPMGDRTTQP